jgi:hypothetical protein
MYRIKYRDKQGRLSLRVVRPVNHGPIGFSARCELRVGALRSFAYANLIEAIDMETGEVLDSYQFKERIQCPST